MLVQKNVSTRRQRTALIILTLCVLGIVATMWYAKRPVSVSGDLGGRVVPSLSGQRAPRNITTDVLRSSGFQQLRAMTSEPVAAGAMGRDNPFVAQ